MDMDRIVGLLFSSVSLGIGGASLALTFAYTEICSFVTPMQHVAAALH